MTLSVMKLSDILPKRTALELIRYFSQFSRAERLKVKFVVMDLSSTFPQGHQSDVSWCNNYW